jgi:beta-lactamase class A
MWTLALAPPVVRADDLGSDEPPLAAVPCDAVPDRAPLWDDVDPRLQRRLVAVLDRLGLGRPVGDRHLAVALVDITRLDRPRVAAVNGDHMMYAASLPKIAILLAAFEKIHEGRMRLDPETEALLTRMIRVSSNSAATEIMDRVGRDYIADVLCSDRYRLYDPGHNGGLWVGKRYAKTEAARRDPLHNISHGATVMQIARFYYLLEKGELVSPAASRKMKQILSNPGINHKFVRGLLGIRPEAALYRKSGTWQQWHADSAIVEDGGRRYIAAALAESPEGGRWLQDIIVAVDGLVSTSASAGAGVSARAEGW